jgi:Cu-Zn family superoxide dismutase
MRRSVIYVVSAGVLVGVGVVALLLAPAASSDSAGATAVLRTADGSEVGHVDFESDDGGTTVTVELEVPDGVTATRAFHGLHVHANDDPANGDGCVADPEMPAGTWFTSADGHLKQDGQLHGAHAGDMPPVELDGDGRGRAEFSSGRLALDDLDGRAVVLHAGLDNFGNVPVGTGPEQYTPNAPAALDKTHNTGNAGDRVACGIVEQN